jgi:hypothetical protein
MPPGEADARATAENDDLGLHLANCSKVPGTQVFEALRGPFNSLAPGAQDDALRDLFPIDTYPSRSIPADGLHVGFVGLQLHAYGALVRCTKSMQNYGQIIGFHP